MPKKNPKVYLDIAKGSQLLGRVTFELYRDITPLTAENFRALCTGEQGTGKHTKKKLHYRGNKFHRIIDGFVMQGGDIENGDGSGGESIYGPSFNDENFERRHAHAGLLSMANCGPDTNASQFFITLKPCPHLDGRHVVFGQVVDGMDVIFECAKVPTDMNDKPRIPVTIYDCGEVDTKVQHIGEDELIGSLTGVTKRERERIEKIKQLEQEDLKKAQEEEKVKGVVEVDEDIENQDHPEFKDEKARKLHELKLKMNQARKMNNQAVIEENERLSNPAFDRMRKRKEWEEQQKDYMAEVGKKGVSMEKKYLTDTVSKTEKMKKRNQKKETFGWDVFNDDAVYRAYEKRAEKLNKDDIDDSNLAPEDKKKLEQERLDRLVEDIEAQRDKRSHFKRRRMHVEEKDVDYINERNKNFNKKLERNFSKYASEIKANLERGSAV